MFVSKMFEKVSLTPNSPLTAVKRGGAKGGGKGSGQENGEVASWLLGDVRPCM